MIDVFDTYEVVGGAVVPRLVFLIGAPDDLGRFAVRTSLGDSVSHAVGCATESFEIVLHPYSVLELPLVISLFGCDGAPLPPPRTLSDPRSPLGEARPLCGVLRTTEPAGACGAAIGSWTELGDRYRRTCARARDDWSRAELCAALSAGFAELAIGCIAVAAASIVPAVVAGFLVLAAVFAFAALVFTIMAAAFYADARHQEAILANTLAEWRRARAAALASCCPGRVVETPEPSCF